MAFTALCTVSQGTDKTKFTITDTSDYTAEGKGTMLSRSLVIYKADGTVFRPTGYDTDTIDFSYASYPSDAIELSGLDKDYAFSVVMTIVSSGPVVGSTYIYQLLSALTGYTMGNFYDRMKRINNNPRYEHNRDYIIDSYKLLMEADNAANDVANNDIESAQLSLDRAYFIQRTNVIPY